MAAYLQHTNVSENRYREQMEHILMEREGSLATSQHHTEAEEIIIRNLISPQISSSVSSRGYVFAADRMLASCSVSGPVVHHANI